MTNEQMIEKIQEVEMTAWNDYQRALEENGGHDGSTISYAMKQRHAAVRDLMESLGITRRDGIERK